MHLLYWIVALHLIPSTQRLVFPLSITPITQFHQFEFAPNGVCIKPYWFVTVTSDATSTISSSKQNPWIAASSTSNPTVTVTPISDTSSKSSSTPNAPRYFTMRNVPGDGDCMFQAIALGAATSLGLGANMALLRMIAKETRQVVASVLESSGNLYIEQSRLVSAQQLLTSAAKQEGIAPEEYLTLLRKEGTDGGLYGGGPELTVLSNVLRRPISVYELKEDLAVNSQGNNNIRLSVDSYCPIVCKGVFGEPVFQDPCLMIPNAAILSNLQPGAYSWHLHILVVNAGKEKHACVLLPQYPT